MTQQPSIARLFVYPVKGLRGIEVDEARVTPLGLAGDRRYMLVDSDGRFMTQRRHPALARFRVEGVGLDAVRITNEAGKNLVLPFAPKTDASSRVQVQIWDDAVEAVSFSPEADAFFSDALGEDVRLVWMPEDADRFADPTFAPEGSRVSFADGFPILVLGIASIDELNTRLEEPVSINRFRANVLVDGSGAWEEDDWEEMRFSDVRLRLVKPCARCVVITTDQDTGERGKEPTMTLATYRKRDGKVLVGMNAVASSVGAVLRTGETFRTDPD